MEGLICEHYRLVEKVGEGGIAEVWAAEHVQIGQRVAIKLLKPEMSSQSEFVRRFLKEAKAVAAIDHRGVIQIYGYGRANDGRAYISMEYLNGESLAACLSREGRLPIARSKRLMRQLAAALSAAHDKSIWHRDLKPDNLFLVPDPEVEGGERVKVLDFGLAKISIDLADSTATVPGSIFGTPAYMAPEQCLDSGSVDGRADLYSIGCILYRCLCGRRPFESHDHLALLEAQLKQMPTPPQHHRPEISAHLNALVMRLLAKSRDERVQDCAELIAELDGKSVPRALAIQDSEGIKTLVFKGGMLGRKLPGVAYRGDGRDEPEGVDDEAATDDIWPGTPGGHLPDSGSAQPDDNTMERPLERDSPLDMRPSGPMPVRSAPRESAGPQYAEPHAAGAGRSGQPQAHYTSGTGPGAHNPYAPAHPWSRPKSNGSISGGAGQFYRPGYGLWSRPRRTKRWIWILGLCVTVMVLASVPILFPAEEDSNQHYAAERQAAAAALAEGRYADAYAACERILTELPDDPDAHVQCAHAGCALGDNDKVRRHADAIPADRLGWLLDLCLQDK